MATTRGDITALGLDQADEWRRVIRAAGADDVCYWPEYAALWEANGDGTARLIHFQNVHGAVVYPILVRPVLIHGRETGYCDTTSPYGYSGPFLAAAAPAKVPDLAREFRSALHAYCLQNRVVTEFIRYHPLLETYREFAAEPGFAFVHPTVVVDLTQPPDQIWRGSFDGRTRTAIRKAQALGVRVVRGEDESFLASFTALYRETMRRVGAGSYYFFPDAFFARLGRSIGQMGTILQAESGGVVIASTILLKGSRFLHYFLSASNPASRRVPAGNLLLYHAVQWGISEGLQAFHLGGGHGDGADSLFRFKAGFSPDRRRYCIGKVIHQPVAYEALMAASFGPNRPAAGLFPLYRHAE